MASDASSPRSSSPVLRPMVRALYGAVRVPGHEAPGDTAHLKVFYPGVFTGAQAEIASGELPVDPAAPDRLPVVVFLPGVNVNPDSYGWLARRLVAEGFVAVVPTWVGPLLPGQVGISPGVDLVAMRPETYGSVPACPLLRPVLDALVTIDAGAAPNPLTGRIDLARVVVGGHSAGGSMALLSADDRFFPEVVGGFAFGAHNQPSTFLGWEAGAMPPYHGTAPLLIAAGTDDGVIKASAFRYGQEHEGAARRDPVRRTFEEAVGADRAAWLLVLDGANHLLCCDPHDETSARGFLEEPTDPALEAAARERFAAAAVALCRLAVGWDGPDALDACCDPTAAGVADGAWRRVVRSG